MLNGWLKAGGPKGPTGGPQEGHTLATAVGCPWGGRLRAAAAQHEPSTRTNTHLDHTRLWLLSRGAAAAIHLAAAARLTAAAVCLLLLLVLLPLLPVEALLCNLGRPAGRQALVVALHTINRAISALLQPSSLGLSAVHPAAFKARAALWQGAFVTVQPRSGLTGGTAPGSGAHRPSCWRCGGQ